MHYFQITSLQTSTDYTFSFLINGNRQESSNYKFTTAGQPSGNMPTSNLAWGKVYTPDHQPAIDAIVYLNIPGASPLSSRVTSNGYWNISLATSFDINQNTWFTPPENIEEDIVVLYPNSPPTQITSSTSRNNPVPDIIIGRNSFSSVSASGEEPPGVIDLPDPGAVQIPLDIINPKNNESINTQKPDFFGSGPANTVVEIQVESPQTFTGQVHINDDGSWNWSPPENLEPGEHTITVTATDPETGLVETVKRRFVVLAADNDNLAFTASQSASQASPTPTTIPTPTAKVSSASPSPTQIPTVTPATIPTKKPDAPTPIPSITSSSSGTQSSLLESGQTTPTLLTFIVSTSLIGLGLRLLRKTSI